MCFESLIAFDCIIKINDFVATSSTMTVIIFFDESYFVSFLSAMLLLIGFEGERSLVG